MMLLIRQALVARSGRQRDPRFEPMKNIIPLPRVSVAILVLGIILFPAFLPAAAVAAEPGPTETLQKRIEDLERRNAEQLKALQGLAARLQQLEAQTNQAQVAQAPRPAAAPQPAASPVAGQPAVKAQAPVVKQAAAAPPEQRDATPDKPATGPESVVKKPAPSRSVQTAVEAEHALFDRRLTVEAGLSYSRSDRKQLILSGFLAPGHHFSWPDQRRRGGGRHPDL